MPRFFVFSEESIQCTLCPRRCFLGPGKTGHCKVRRNQDGKPESPFHGFITALALDPIEKKPLYHFRPGTEILSVGFAGCNLHCPFCQNWHISQTTDASGKTFSPAELIDAAVKTAKGSQKPDLVKAVYHNQASLAYTYSEPLVHIEFLLDCMKEAHKAGIANVLVSNGCVNSEAANEVLEHCDAANIDLKCFSGETYLNVLGGDLSSVTGFIQMASKKNVHLEITTLVVPGLNDSEEELDKCRDFIAELQTGGSVVPWHLSAYHPSYKWNAPATDPDFLIAAAKRARKKLEYVYSGNIADTNNTLCPNCKKTLISRRGYKVDKSGLLLKEENEKPYYACASCGEKTPVIAL